MLRAFILLPLCALLAGCGVGFYSAGTGKDNRTPLERVAQAGDLAEVQRLLASGADPNDRGGVFGGPLSAAAFRNHNADVIRALVASGANPNGRGQDGTMCWASPLDHATSAGDLENTRALLDSGAAVSKSACSRFVAGWLQPPIIDLLVQHGLNLFTVDELGRNELHLALAAPTVANFNSIEYLVRAGIPLNARDQMGKTPLAYWRGPRDFETHWFRVWLIER
jgi:ankyrin repeat protein